MLTISQYQKGIFKNIMCEGFIDNYKEAIEYKENVDNPDFINLAKKVFNETAGVLIDDPNRTINELVAYFSEKDFQVKQLATLAGAICNETKDTIRKNELKVPDEVTLEDYEKEVIDAVFSNSKDEESIKQIRDKVFDALQKENEEAKRINDLIVNAEAKETNESLSRIDIIDKVVMNRPRSLMHSLRNFYSKQVFNETKTEIINGEVEYSKLLNENKNMINESSMAVYSIYETLNSKGYYNFVPDEIKKVSYEIYKSTTK